MGDEVTENGTIALGKETPVFGKPPPKRRRYSKVQKNSAERNLFSDESAKTARLLAPSLPDEDNTPAGLQALLAANQHYREVPWPEPYNRTTHRLHLGDARYLSWIADSSVQLIVTSPRYWTL